MSDRMTLIDVSNRIGASVSTISRWRSGGRVPSFKQMQRIEETIGWPVPEQAAARQRSEWTTTFESKLRETFAVEAEGVQA